MSMRLKRLHNEYSEISKAFTGHPYIIIKDAFGNPPEKYLIEYKVKGLVQSNHTIIEKDTHLVEITLPSEYPSAEPICRMSIPVFHPNIDSNKICIADYWVAGESLVDVIVRIGEIISYQNYNIKSPLNGEAAKWVGQNINRFPIDPADLCVNIEEEKTIVTEKEKKAVPYSREKKEVIEQQCSNCDVIIRDLSFYKCINGHVTCPDCTAECHKCAKTICVLCPLNKCSACGKMFCDECKITCPVCSNLTCEEHLGECCACQCGVKGNDIIFQKCSDGHLACPDCIIECQDCDRLLCVSCILIKCSTCGKILCRECQSVCPTCGKPSCQDHRNCCTKIKQSIEDKIKITSEEFSITVSEKSIDKKTVTCSKCGHKTKNLTANFCVMCGYRLQR